MDGDPRELLLEALASEPEDPAAPAAGATAPSVPREEIIRVHLFAHESVAAEIRALQSSRERILGLGLSLLSVAFGIGLRDGIDAFLILAPVGVFALAFYVLSMYTDIMAMGGYKLFLEERLNEEVGENVLAWESISEGTNRRLNLNLPVLVALFGAFILAMGYFGLRSAAAELPSWGGPAYAALLCALSGIAAYSLWNARIVFHQSYEAAWDAFRARGEATPPLPAA